MRTPRSAMSALAFSLSLSRILISTATTLPQAVLFFFFFFKYLIYQKYVIHLEFWRAFPIFTLQMSDFSEKWFCSGLVCACYVHVRFVSGDVRKYYHYSSSVCCCLSVKHLQCFLVIPGEKTHTHSSWVRLNQVSVFACLSCVLTRPSF